MIFNLFKETQRCTFSDYDYEIRGRGRRWHVYYVEDVIEYKTWARTPESRVNLSVAVVPKKSWLEDSTGFWINPKSGNRRKHQRIFDSKQAAIDFAQQDANIRNEQKAWKILKGNQ